MPTPCNERDRTLFASATTITLGDGKKAKFWESAWLQGEASKNIAPAVYEISKRKKRMVKDALTIDRWISDINVAIISSPTHLSEFTLLPHTY